MSIITKEIAEGFKSFITAHNYFLIVGHKEPDGDCIASCLGVAAILDFFGKPYQLLSAGPFKRSEIKKYEHKFSNTMDFLDESERKQTGLIITDCSEIIRLGDIDDADFKGLDTYVIDHHKTAGLPEKAEGYINPDAPACSYLIQLFHEALIGPLSKKTAEIIMFGTCTDTGFFRFLTNSKESADLLAASARLVTYGVEPKKVYNDINYGKPYSTRKLLGVLLNRAEKYLNGKLIVTYETIEDTKKFGIEGRDSDARYQLVLSIKGVEAAVFLRQDTPTTCTGGLRSTDKVDVSIVASKFNGGGHKNASGLSTEGKPDTLIPAIVKEFARIM